MNIPQCIHRRNVEGDSCECASDRVMVNGGQRLKLTECGRCPYADMPNLEVSGAGDVIHRITTATGVHQLSNALSAMGITCRCNDRLEWFNQRLQFGGRKNRAFNGYWTVIVTTAPRRESTLQQCLATCVQNNWSPWVFAEPDSDLTGCEVFTVTQNEERKGAWFNWLNACRTVLESGADGWIMTVQDDVEFIEGARAWFEGNQPKSDRLGMASLYTSRKYHRKDLRGWHRVRTKSLWGACAMAFPAAVLREFVDHPMTAKWRGAPFRTRTRPREDWEVGNIDTAVGKIIREMGLETWFTSPSLCQHVSEFSAMGHGGRKGNREAAEVGLP